MAGGKITIRAGKKITKTSEKYSIYTDRLTLNSNGPIKLTSDQEMVYGVPKEPKTGGEYILRGWWSSDALGEDKIKTAYVEDTVYFTIETKNINDAEILATRLILIRSNAEKKEILTIPVGTEKKGYFKINYKKVYENRVTLSLTLNSNLKEFFLDESFVELFYTCSYKNQNIDLPLSYKDYLKVNEKLTLGGAFLFIITDELLPSGKLVRKVVVPPSRDILSFLKGNNFEQFGMSSPNPLSEISIGEHASGLNNSKYLSASSLEYGAPNINGASQYIDIKKAEAAGCKIYSTEEIVSDLQKLKENAPNLEAKARIDKVINAVSNLEKEVLIEGKIPANAIKSSTSLKLTKGLRVLNVIAIVITAYDIEQAAEKSIDQNSIKPVTAEAIRQIGGWGGAIAGAKLGGIAGVAIGIETGPGAIIIGAAGAIIFGTAGYFGADWIADHIDEN